MKKTRAHPNTTACQSTAPIIDDIEQTSDTLTGRAGLTLFVRYLRGIEIFPHLARLFGSLRKSGKRQPVVEIFKQLFCFFLDGSSRHLVYFDALKEDTGYAGAIETEAEAMLSSHAVKRFWEAFRRWWIWLFRRLLQRLFLWRLRLAQPPVVLLELAPPDQILYTNLGGGYRVDDPLRAAGLEWWLEAEALLEGYHQRGGDELVHRALKDFAAETLPFKKFAANAAYYYTMRVAFFLYECFQEDVCHPVVPLTCYATTLRRRIIDGAGKPCVTPATSF